MLSYKHGFHAGNHADVLKHIVLIYLYNLSKKHCKSMTYIDTHSGNGIYKYSSRYMDKTKEYKYGIKKIEKYTGDNKLIINYLRILKKITKNDTFYPGSPFIISNISEAKDKLFLCEMHSNEFKSLKINLTNFNNVKLINSSGFEYINKISNINNNFFIFIDPSYEIKDDFEKIYNFIDNIEIKYEKAKILIWYPILSYSENDIFIETIRKKGISNILNLELPILKDDDNRGMKGSGLLIINFNNKLIFKNLKLLIRELNAYLTDSNEVFKPKVRYF